MFVVTNRNIVAGAQGTALLGQRTNELGPAELRIVEAVKKDGVWDVKLLPDQISAAMKQEVGITDPNPAYASRYLLERLLAVVNPRHANPQSVKKGKDLLFFVHGFNNSFGDVLERCEGLAAAFDMEVVAFTWPANGGGVKGATDYLDDKRDALASVVAFDRVLAKARDMLVAAREDYLKKLGAEAIARFPDSAERQREFVAKTADQQCPFRVSLLLHSMGNYLFERTLKSSALRGSQLLFDNIVMAAADVNSPGHAQWVDQIQVRNRLYITINENDYALQASRIKGGPEQLARLGHYPYDLDARRAVYVDFTRAAQVGTSHAYFEGAALKNDRVRKFFELALHGRRVEDAALMTYDVSRNLHEVR